MKKDYIKPEIHLEEILLGTQLLSGSMVDIGGNGPGAWDSKDREDFGGEDSDWGDLW
jgi:hypothetical protein